MILLELSIGWPFLNQSHILARGWPRSGVTHSSKSSLPAENGCCCCREADSLSVSSLVGASMRAGLPVFSMILRDFGSKMGRTKDGPVPRAESSEFSKRSAILDRRRAIENQNSNLKLFCEVDGN